MTSLFVEDASLLGTPYWWQHSIAPPKLRNRLPHKADLLIVGAGYTGLSAAIAAHDAGAHVVVAEKDTPGFGASTRNGGMFGAHPRLGFNRLVTLFGEEAAVGIFNEARDAFSFTSNLISDENIDCDFDQCGRIQMAWTQKHLDAQREQVADLNQSTSMSLEFVEREELSSEINSPCYLGGIRFPDHASLHPKKFHDGLLAACLARGITVVPNCEIVSIDRANKGSETRSGFHVEAVISNEPSSSVSSTAIKTPKVKLLAEKVIMATNGYTSGRFRWFQRRVFPLPSYLIATEQVSKNLLDYLAPGKRMMVETRARHSYFRLSPDGQRILFGGRASVRNIPLSTAATRLHATMSEVWPELKTTKITHCWSGNTGYSFNHMPHVGCHNGIHYAMGFSGSGTALAPYLGAKVAYTALGDSRGNTSYKLSTLKTHWVHQGGKPLFLKPVDAWYRQVVDRIEAR